MLIKSAAKTNYSPRWIVNLNAMYYYVYALLSEKDNKLYTGYTADLNERLKLHNTAKVESTKNRLPLKLIYREGCINQQDATRREKYLKSGSAIF
jgi:putative endonuclease